MHQRLAEITDGIERAAAALRRGYQADELYALRVGMRRLRSMLRPIGSTRSRRFRKTWGGFATVTNQARDWDVFLLAAGGLLPTTQSAEFERRHRGEVAACHEAVTELMHSAYWRRHLQDWRRYLLQCNGKPGEGTLAAKPLIQAFAKARAALANARKSGDDRAWHKLRIAIKEVRYQAESGAVGSVEEPTQAGLIEQCKVLQSQLGGWHDCVIQLQMLEEFEPAPDHDTLRMAIKERRMEYLARIRQMVVGHPLFEIPEGAHSRARSDSSSGS